MKTIRFKELADAGQVEDGMLRTRLEALSSPGSMQNVYNHFSRWHDWLQVDGVLHLRGKSPTELIEYQHELNRKSITSDKIVNRREILREIIRFVQSGKAWRQRYRVKLLSDVSSVFSYVLQDNGGFPKAQRTDFNLIKGESRVQKKLTYETVRTILGGCNPMYKAVFTCMLASGMGVGEIVQWSSQGIEKVEEALRNPVNRDPEVIEVYLKPRKSSRDDYYCMIGGGAINHLRAWLVKREEMKRGEKAPTPFPDVVFVNNLYQPLTVKGAEHYWLKQLERAGLYTSLGEGDRRQRSGLNLHQIRSCFRTRWQKSRADALVAEAFMGHTVDALDYNKIMNDKQWTLEQYRAAVRWLDIDKADPDETSQEVQRVREEAEKTRAAMQAQLEEQQRMIEEMAPAFRAAQRMLEQSEIWDALRADNMNPSHPLWPKYSEYQKKRSNAP